jgi:hypothetical protein
LAPFADEIFWLAVNLTAFFSKIGSIFVKSKVLLCFWHNLEWSITRSGSAFVVHWLHSYVRESHQMPTIRAQPSTIYLADNMPGFCVHHWRYEGFVESWMTKLGSKAVGPLNLVVDCQSLLIMHASPDIILHVLIKSPHTVPLETK